MLVPSLQQDLQSLLIQQRHGPVCVRGLEKMCVCVCGVVCGWVGGCVCTKDYVCVRELEKVCVWVRLCVCVCVCVCVVCGVCAYTMYVCVWVCLNQLLLILTDQSVQHSNGLSLLLGNGRVRHTPSGTLQ